jgi:hypothetical protein
MDPRILDLTDENKMDVVTGIRSSRIKEPTSGGEECHGRIDCLRSSQQSIREGTHYSTIKIQNRLDSKARKG